MPGRDVVRYIDTPPRFVGKTKHVRWSSGTTKMIERSYSKGIQHVRKLCHTTDMLEGVGHLQTELLTAVQHLVDDRVVRHSGYAAVTVAQCSQVLNVADQHRIASAQEELDDLSCSLTQAMVNNILPCFEEC